MFVMLIITVIFILIEMDNVEYGMWIGCNLCQNPNSMDAIVGV